MKTSMYVTELSFIKRRLVEDIPPIDNTAVTEPAPGPDPTTTAKEKPAPSSIKKATPAETPKKSQPKDVKAAFVGGALSDIGTQLFNKAYGVLSGDIYHNPQGRVGNNPAYTGSGYNR